MNMLKVLQEYISEYRRSISIRNMTKDDFVHEVYKWASELAKQGKQEGMFNITEFRQHYPNYPFNATEVRHLLCSQGLHVIGRIHKECRQHPQQMCINWMNQTDYDYFYNGGRD